MRLAAPLLSLAISWVHKLRRRRPAVLIGGAIVALFLLSQVPALLSLLRLTAMSLAALSIRTHESAPLPVVVPGLLAAHWKAAPEEDPATFLKLHVFSEDTAEGRRRRDVIRKHNPVAWACPESVEFKFVVPQSATGRLEHTGGDIPPNSNTTAEGTDDRIPDRSQARRSRRRRGGEGESSSPEVRSAIDAEEAEFGDILRIPEPDVAAGWILAVGRTEPSRWVMKCDDSTLPVLPNIIRDLRRRNWRTPTYFGTTSGRNLDRPFHYRGMLYGFSWPVVETVASAKIASGVEADDAERIGQLMWSLPSTWDMPRLLRGYPCLPQECSSFFQEGTMRPALFDRLKSVPDYPRPKDPRTGLNFVNYLDRIEGPTPWIRNDLRTVIAYYGLDEEAYVQKFEQLDRQVKKASCN